MRNESETAGLQKFEEIALAGLVAPDPLVARPVPGSEQQVPDLAHPLGPRHVALHRLAGARGLGVGVDAENPPRDLIFRQALVVRLEQASVGFDVPVVVVGQALRPGGLVGDRGGALVIGHGIPCGCAARARGRGAPGEFGWRRVPDGAGPTHAAVGPTRSVLPPRRAGTANGGAAGDHDRLEPVARRIVDHLELCGMRCVRTAPVPTHDTPGPGPALRRGTGADGGGAWNG